MMTPPVVRLAAAVRRHNTPMDPHGVLGLPPTATPDEIAATYRRLAKEWHPDRGGGADAERRMAEINAAYDLLRATAWTAAAREPRRRRSAARRRAPAAPGSPPAIRQRARPRAARRRSSRTSASGSSRPTTTWASPQALLAASDRRLLWLLDDAVNGRVQTLRFAAIEAAEHSAPPPAQAASPRSASAPATAAGSRSASSARRPPRRSPGGSPPPEASDPPAPDRAHRGRRQNPHPSMPPFAGAIARARPISATGTTASSASAAIAHQPAS